MKNPDLKIIKLPERLKILEKAQIRNVIVFYLTAPAALMSGYIQNKGAKSSDKYKNANILQMN